MKHKKLLIAGLLLLSPTGCTNMNNTEQGAVSGGAIGALFGALLGGPRHWLAGAAIGGGAGALAGGAIGNSQDRADDRRTAQAIAVANAQAARQMSLTDIVQLSQTKTPDQIIINQIRTSGSVFDLRADDITYLRSNGVSDVVVAEMQTRRYPRAVYVAPPPPRDVIYVGPPPQPPPYGAVIYAR